MTRLAVLAALFVLGLCGSSTARADNFSNPVVGGPGGRGFVLACAPGAFLTGFTLRSGAWINGITGECGILTPEKDRFFPGAPRFTPAAGGGGTERRAACAPNQYMGGLKFGFTRNGNKPKYVDYVQLECFPLRPTGNPSILCLDSGGNGCWDKHPSPGPYNGFGLVFQSRCSLDTYPDAILGRAGSALDALALRCAARP